MNMSNLKLFKTGAIALIALGVIHLLAQFYMGKPTDPVANKLMLDMQNFKIDLMGQHSILQFYNGFSIMMGFLLSAFGIQHLILAKEILTNRYALLGSIFITAIAVVIAVVYFHVLAYGFLFTSLVCFVIVFLKNKSPKQTT